MKVIASKLKLVSGLHIGGGDDSMKIGGVDWLVIKREVFCDKNGVVSFGEKRRKITEPYIPGSSLKGKIRSLLEYKFRLHNKLLKVFKEKEKSFLIVLQNYKILDVKEFNNLDNKEIKEKIKQTNEFKEFNEIDKLLGSSINSKMFKYFNEKDLKYASLIVKLFGESAPDGKGTITRTIFRDSYITDEVRKLYLQNKVELSEEKAENKINRLTGSTEDGGLRFIERVPSGVEFDFEVVIRDLDEDSDNEKELFKDTILLGLKLLELDTLGGSGSRGYGKVEFNNLKVNKEEIKVEIDNLVKKIEDNLK